MAITDFKSLLGREPVDGDQVRVWRFIRSDVEPQPVQQVTLTFRLGQFRPDKGYWSSEVFSTKESAEKAYVAWLLQGSVGEYAKTAAADADACVDALYYELKQAQRSASANSHAGRMTATSIDAALAAYRAARGAR